MRRLGKESDAIVSSFSPDVDERVNDVFRTVFRMGPDPQQNALARQIQGRTDVVRQEVKHPEIERLFAQRNLPSNSTQASEYKSLLNDRLNSGDNKEGIIDYESFRNEMRRLGRQGRYAVDQAAEDADRVEMARRLYGELSELASRILRDSGVPQETVDRLRAVRQQQNGAFQAEEWLQNERPSVFKEFWKTRYALGAMTAITGVGGGLLLNSPLLMGTAAGLGALASIMGPSLRASYRRDVLTPMMGRLREETPHIAALMLRSQNALNSARTADERRAALQQQAVVAQLIMEDEAARDIVEQAGEAVDELNPGVRQFLDTLRPADAPQEVTFEEYMQGRNARE